MKKQLKVGLIVLGVLGVGAIGDSIMPPDSNTDFTKCGAMTGRTVDLERQEVRYKFAFCDEEFVITKLDMIGVSEQAKEDDGEVKIENETGLEETIDIDDKGNILNVSSEEK